MLLTDVVVHAIDASLEHREVALNRVGVDVAAHIFAKAVIDAFVFVKETP